ncbi:SAM-dependent methyltransferase [Cryptosporangium minutisporangium]|uniref:SAM-dependent methyltransferase n=1 Tax=Cryptosporangium minutisporangium TaxID=113569 RepID=A0ABP6T1W2_9ACTN
MEQELRAEIRQRMTAAAIRQLALSAATGIRSGRVRFGLVNGYVAQKLLFSRDLDRRPVSMRLFRLVWPLLWQRRLLMPLVGRKGIYCFYSRELLTELVRMAGGRPCLEIAAGDGTLARFLRDQGADVTATDDYSWKHAIDFPGDVERLDAAKALRRYQPAVVFCSWPPAGNGFEREVFATESVELYVVISSKHEYAAGDWASYRRQRSFDFAEDSTLSRLVLPPELDSAVYVFRRRHPSG